ncbi:MAG: MaoC family dehydratase N-terminal domain-containing protein [Candidatus Rokubacteria bacterium]|nr:MaoC family dehydratase N-terminal domain-containing protein [Candidatus Rokubacteria bacterium]
MGFDIARVKAAWEGHETTLTAGRYPIEFDPIRRHCHMVEDTNPLFLEQGICPPVMVDYFASQGAWPPGELDILGLIRQIPTPGDRLVNMNHEFEWFRTVRVGDRLTVSHKVVSVDVKPTRLDPLSVWIKTETRIVDERGETVALRWNQILIHRTPEQVKADWVRPEAAP